MKKAYSVSEFKAKSLGLFEDVVQKGESFIVTKRGKPIARVIPFVDAKTVVTSGKLEGTLLAEGDLVTPFGAGIWQAAEGED